jgi:glycosyltransferase involved in cell wall biosynthesis
MTQLSVIICTHNPRRDYLRRVLEALRAQTLPVEQWELIIVDDASERPLAGEWDLSWHPAARHVREEELGIAVARQRGIREASADLLLFVDDDNVLDPNYLVEAIGIGGEWPQLGVWGGSIVPEFEMEPPEHLKKFLSHLALRKIDAPRWSNVATCDDALPWGAGMCLRAAVATAYCRHYQHSRIRCFSRRGKELLGGEDNEICYVACEIGFGMGVFPTLKVTHLIPRQRVTEGYLVRLIEGMATSRFLLAFSWRGVTPRSPLGIIELLRLIKNLTTHRGIERRLYLSNLRAIFRARSMISRASARSFTPQDEQIAD